MKHLTLIILLILIESTGFAQQKKIAFEKYGVAEGLPEEFVSDILQDDKGFIWFGTQNGLVKYDGYHFQVFRGTLDKTYTSGLQIKLVSGLIKSRDGKIWISGYGERGGISSFDPASEKFKNYYTAGNVVNGTDLNYSNLLFEDKDGIIWFIFFPVITGQGYTCRLDPASGIIKEYPVVDINGGNPYFKKFGTVESSNAIWLLDNKSNIRKLNSQKDSFEIVIPAGTAFSSSGIADTIKQLGKGSEDKLLLTGLHGLYIFQTQNQKIVKSYIHKAGNTNGIADSIFGAMEDVKGQIWVMHQHGIISLIDPSTDNIQTFSYGSRPLFNDKGQQKIFVFYPGNQNKEGIWFQALGIDASPKFFLYYHFANKSFSLYDYNFNVRDNPLPQKPYPYIFLEDRTNLLWLGTRPGLYKQAPKNQQMTLFRHWADEPNSLPSDSIRYLFEDSKKRLWIGSRNGLALFRPDQDNFLIFKNDPTNAASLSNNFINTVQEDADGKIWVGTENGLNQWQESTGSFMRFFCKPGEINNIAFLFPDKQQRLWLSILNKGVFVLDKNTGRAIKNFLPDEKNPASLTSKRIDVFYQDSKGNIWLGDGYDNKFGLYLLNQSEDGFVHYLPIPGDSSSVSSNEISFLAEDGKNRLWIGTDGGLNLYHFDQKSFTRFMNYDLVSVNFFTTDKQGEPWFGTYAGGGLVNVDPEKKIITAYGESKGLLHNDINSGLNGLMAKDDFGRLWLPTQRGLSVFDPETKSFISYFEKDGFQPYARSYRSIKTSNGDIWIGGYNGLNRIVPADLLKKDTTLASVAITQITILDSAYSRPDGKIFKKSVAYTNNFQVKYWQKDISFDFVALHYLRPEDNLYSWKLENYDKDWSVPSKEGKASYTNLSPGDYVFRVKASNADGVWNEDGIYIAMTILPPWWRTWLAYIVYALLFLFALRTYSLWRLRHLRLEKEHLQTKVEERTSELKKSLEEIKSTQTQLIQSEKMASLGELTAGIAHEIQNPLNFVNNFSEVNKELLVELKDEIKKGNFEGVDAIAEDVISNEEKINQHGKRAESIVKGMLLHSRGNSGHKEPVDINALANEYLRLSYHGMRAKDKSFNAEYKTEFDPNLPKINVVPQDIGRVLLNLINNAFYAVNTPQHPEGGVKNTQIEYRPTVTISTTSSKSPLGDSRLNDAVGQVGVKIIVKDNGSGIPDSIKDKIFQPFFTTKPTGQGTGLGLSLAYDIVKAHGGELKVETKEGEGSVFIIQLPYL
jgi:signal transduction histidine kinase/ligand-binding sensor domain-containing protein